MTLSSLAALGSFVSGIAVLVSLIFLGLQMRQANRNQRALMQQGISSRYLQILSTTATPEIAKTMMRVAQGNAGLEPWEIVVAMNAIGAIFVNCEDSFLQYRAGTLDDVSWATEVAAIRGHLRFPLNRAVWRMNQDFFGSEFRGFVDGVLESTKGDLVQYTLTEAWNAPLAADRSTSPPQ